MDEQRVPVLCYHRLYHDDDSLAPPVQPGTYCGHVLRSTFERQMRYLAERGCSVITHADLLAWLADEQPIPERSVLVDFDDNRLSVLEHAYPILRDHGWPATVFVISCLADGQSPWGPGDYPALSWRELDHLVEAGWLIGAHTRTHPWLDELYDEPDGPQRVEEELAGCKADIQHYLGLVAGTFAYPGGRNRPEVEEMVHRYYRSARLWDPGGPIPVGNLGQTASPLASYWQSPTFKEPGNPVFYNTQGTDRYRIQANNISELTDDAFFRRLIDRAMT